MTPLYTFNGLLLKVGNALAAGPDCCCEESCCCLDFANVNFSFTIDCGGGNETFTGTLDNSGNGIDTETGLWSISTFCTTIQCTPEDLCANSGQSCVGYFISVIKDGCGANALYLCEGNAELWIGGICDNNPQADFTADLFKCVGGVPSIIGSITFFP